MAATSVLLSGCDPDTAVFVEANIENADLSMTSSGLTAAVGGSFDVRLHLAERASGAAEVDNLGFSMTNGQTTLVDVVGATINPSFPVTVQPGSDVVVRFTLAPDDNLVDTANVDALCQPPGVIIIGAVDDSLRGGSVDITSDPVAVSGCM